MENVNRKLLICFLITLIELIFEYLSFNFNDYIYSVVALVLTIFSLVFLIYIYYYSKDFDHTLKKLLIHLIGINAFALVTSVFIILYIVLIKKPTLEYILSYISLIFFCFQIILLTLLTILNRKSEPLQRLLWIVCTTVAIISIAAIYFIALYIRYIYGPNQQIKQLKKASSNSR
jgi:cytochrome bd-type quinol oxidase subunit 2